MKKPKNGLGEFFFIKTGLSPAVYALSLPLSNSRTLSLSKSLFFSPKDPNRSPFLKEHLKGDRLDIKAMFNFRNYIMTGRNVKPADHWMLFTG